MDFYRLCTGLSTDFVDNKINPFLLKKGDKPYFIRFLKLQEGGVSK